MEQDIIHTLSLFPSYMPLHDSSDYNFPGLPPPLIRQDAHRPGNIQQLYRQYENITNDTNWDDSDDESENNRHRILTSINNILYSSNMDNDDNDTLNALRLIGGLSASPSRDSHTLTIIPMQTTMETRNSIRQYVQDANYQAAWHLSRIETCHAFAYFGIDPVNLLPLLADNHMWSDGDKLVYGLLAGRGIEILKFLGDSSLCFTESQCRHYPRLFELAMNSLPPCIINDEEDSKESIVNVEEAQIETLVVHIVQVFSDEGNSLAWPYLLTISERFPELAERLVMQVANIDCSHTIPIMSYRSYNPKLFTRACKLSKINNIDTLVELSNVSDIEELVSDLCTSIRWSVITEKIHGIIHLLKLQLDYVSAIRTMSDRLNGWQHVAIAIVLFGNDIMTYQHFIQEINYAMVKPDVDKLPRVLHERLMTILAYTDLQDSAIDLLPLIQKIAWHATNVSSPVTIDFSCKLDLEGTLQNAPFAHLDIDNYLMCRIAGASSSTQHRKIYDMALVHNCSKNGRLEYLVESIRVIKDLDHISDDIVVGLLMMAVRFMNPNQYWQLTDALNNKTAQTIIEELSKVLNNMVDQLQIIHIVSFIQSQIVRFPSLELTLTVRKNLLSKHYLLSIPIIILLVLNPHHVMIAENTHPWIEELASNNQDHHLDVNNEYGNNPIVWAGDNTLSLARANLDSHREAWTIMNGEGLDYGGIRKEFFSAIGKEIAESCDKFGEYLLPRSNLPAELLYDIGCILGRSCFIDGHALHMALHPFIQVMLCWDWILCPTNNSYPWRAIELLLGQERLLEIAPQMYYRIKNLSIDERELLSSHEMINEMMARFAEWVPAVMCMRAGFLRYRRTTILPPKYLDMRIGGAGVLQIDQLTALLQTTGSGAISDLLPIYADMVISILEDWPLADQTRFYSFWFGTERPRWDSDEPPKLVIVGPGGQAALSRTCFNQLEISRMEDDDLCKLRDHVEQQMRASLNNQAIAEQAGLLYQMN
jgi:hypothetical protein